ncbi:odorant receptor 10-like [Neodiprion pinetum]|uniref:odorant receptor 10-like n=1 Tax=Neodiprion pinetum TaxID=441929 RepID=UPI001EDF825E|nr:odorant receptor 49b-like [Neodiprion pinetum]
MWDHSAPADRKIISTWIIWAKFISTVYFLAANCVVTVFIMTTTLQQRSSPKNSTTKFYPFTPQEDSTPSPRYEIKYAVQVICCFCSMSYIAACDMTGTILSFNICGQLAVIRSWLEELAKGKLDPTGKKTDESRQEGLKKCIRRHQLVLDLCAELEDVNQYNYLIQLVTEMYIMAISAAQLTKLQNFGSLRHLITVLLAINGLFFSCWPAETLSVESRNIATAIYEVPWDDASLSVRAMIIIMLGRSQRPATLSAGKFLPLSLEAFSSITSSGISFCMVLSSF